MRSVSPGPSNGKTLAAEVQWSSSEQEGSPRGSQRGWAATEPVLPTGRLGRERALPNLADGFKNKAICSLGHHENLFGSRLPPLTGGLCSRKSMRVYAGHVRCTRVAPPGHHDFRHCGSGPPLPSTPPTLPSFPLQSTTMLSLTPLTLHGWPCHTGHLPLPHLCLPFPRPVCIAPVPRTPRLSPTFC